jgi:hypothetical protein
MRILYLGFSPDKGFASEKGGKVYTWRSGALAPRGERKSLFSKDLKRTSEFATCSAQRGELARMDVVFRPGLAPGVITPGY